MHHADKEVFLAGVGEKLDEGHSAVVAYHRKARNAGHLAQGVQDVHESPVHLKALAGFGRVAAASVGGLGRKGPL